MGFQVTDRTRRAAPARSWLWGGALPASIIGALLAGTATAAPVPHEELVIHAGAVIAIPGERTLGPTTIVVRDHRIADVRAGYVDFPDVPTIDLKDRTVLPGLIDTHVHFSFAPETRLWSAAIDTAVITTL